MVGGPWHIIPHLYTTYILPIGGLYVTYHLLGEPETTIESTGHGYVPYFLSMDSCIRKVWLVNLPPPRNKGLIFGLFKGNQRLISPAQKAGYFWGGTLGGG